MFVCAYNPSYSGGSQFETSLGKIKKLDTPSSQQIKQSVVVSNCNPSYAGGIGRRITV
jgi:hypothetical protein